MIFTIDPFVALIGITLLAFIFFAKQKYDSVKKAIKEASREPVDFYKRLREVVDAHTDYTAEIVTMVVSGERAVDFAQELEPGDELQLQLIKGEVKAYIYGRKVGDLSLKDESKLPGLLAQEIDIEAYYGDYDRACLSSKIRVCSVLAFYKVDGIPPTHVNIEL